MKIKSYLLFWLLKAKSKVSGCTGLQGIIFTLKISVFVLFPMKAFPQHDTTSQFNNARWNLQMEHEFTGPVINDNHPDVINSQNKSGFETGQIVKLGKTYHMFVNEMFDRPHRDLRIAYWTSADGTQWRRKTTVFNSIAPRSPDNPRSEVWVTGVVYNEIEQAWNIFYVAYRAGDKLKGEIEGNDYQGRIWRAKSIQPGVGGIGGPYADQGVVLEPDQNSQNWEGQQAVACFSPYKAGKIWLSLYDGHNHLPRGNWPTGMAFAYSLKGPWTRMPEGFNPLPIADVFMENEIVTRMKDGTYVMIFDSLGDQQIGYALSHDGINWTHERRVKIQSDQNKWAANGDHATRTPLCLIEEADGNLSVIYTALKNDNTKKFYAIGKCTLKWGKSR